MKYKISLLTLVALLLSLSVAFAGNQQRIGTAGALELTIPVGSRGTAMGGAVIANAYGVEAAQWNPAGLASIEGTEAMFTHLPYIADIDVNFGGIATNMEDFGVLGFSAKVVSIGDIEETTEEQPYGTGNIYSPTLSVLGLTYSRQLTANVAFGVTGMYINENVFDVSASGVAFDVGFQYNPRWRGLTLGIVLKNYGPDMTFRGDGFERTYEAVGKRRVASNGASFELPSSFNLGVAYNLYQSDLHVASLCGNFRSNNLQEDFWQGGLEYGYSEWLFLRAGYNYSDQRDYIYGASLGAGLVYPMGDTKLTFEYAWLDTETFDDNQFFTVKFNF